MNIAIIGAGNVGATTASLLICASLCRKVTLIDTNRNLAVAKAIDLSQMVAVFNQNIEVAGGDDYALLSDFDIVIITAGFARKSGQNRDELMMSNAKIVALSAVNIAKFAPKAIIINVTNPLDIMSYVALKASKFQPSKVIGMAGELDSARLKFEISQKIKFLPDDFTPKCVGTHDENMICLENSMKIGSRNLENFLQKSEIDEIIQNTKNGGARFLNLVNSSAFYAPSAGVVKICKNIKNGGGEILSCAVFDGEAMVGRLVRIGKNGVSEILNAPFSQKEAEIFAKSVENFRKNMKIIDRMLD